MNMHTPSRRLLIGLLALAACLLEPLWSRERAKPGANFFVILADNSQGMAIKDRGAARSRGEMLRGIVTGDETKWQSKLGEASDLMTGINEKWNGFIEGLPTSKDYDFEDVAKHYFPRETGLVAKYTKLLSAMKSDRK